MTEADHVTCKELGKLFEAGKIKGSFAASLLKQYAERNSLSDKQMFYARKLVSEGTGERENASESKQGDTARSYSTEVVDASQLQQLFHAALRAHVQYPHVQYPIDNTNDREHLRVFLADNHKDIVFISERTRTRFAWIKGLTNELRGIHNQSQIGTALYQQIRRIIDDPIGEAVVHGKQTGRCMFCARSLENAFSVDHGYGPICAENYGLPWVVARGGKKIAVHAEDLLASLEDGSDDDIPF